MCTLPCAKSIGGGKMWCSTGSSVQCSVMTMRVRMGCGGREAQEGGEICISILGWEEMLFWLTSAFQIKGNFLKLNI